MLIRREVTGDAGAIDAVHTGAFAAGTKKGTPAEVELVHALRESPAFIPQLSNVAVADAGVVGHVMCVRCTLGANHQPVLGVVPLGVCPEFQSRGVGSALMHSVLGAADAMNEPLLCVLGSTDYYRRFGFVLAGEHRIEPSVADWSDHFQVRTLTTFHRGLTGLFVYPAPVSQL